LSPESSLTEGFFIACLEPVEVSSRPLSAAELEADGRSRVPSVVSESTGGEMQIQNAAAGDGRKSHRRKKLKKEKAAKLESLEVDATVVEEESKSEFDEQSQKSGNTSVVRELTVGTLEAEHETAEEKRKSHKRKKSKKEKATKVAKLEHSEINMHKLDHDWNAPDTLHISDVVPVEQVAACDDKKSHKRKKSKKEKTNGMDEARSEIEPDKPSRKSFSENVSCVGESTGDEVQTECDAVVQSRKSQKHKRSKMEKVEKTSEHSETIDSVKASERSKLKKSKKHKKHKAE